MLRGVSPLKAHAFRATGRTSALWVIALLAASPAVSWGAAPEPSEVGHYSFAAFPPGNRDASLPPELLRPAGGTALPAAFPALDGTVEITWEAREAFDFRGYRVTTLMQGAGLDPLVAQWTVDPWSGVSGRDPRQRLYRLRLPVLAPGVVRLRTTLEALRPQGTPVLLAVRESVASGEPGSLQSSQSARVEAGRTEIAAVSPRETCAETPRVAEPFDETSLGLPDHPPSVGARQSHSRPEPRGPPARAHATA